jgi:hypothetical protein
MYCLLLVLGMAGTVPAMGQDISQYGVKKTLGKGITMGGGLNFNTVAYKASGIDSRRDPFNWFLSGNININLFGFNMPFSFSLSNAGKNYTQPFNRIQLRPYWKWIRAYWGNTSMTFSPLTLSGHLFNGYGIELTRNRWQFSAMQGRLREAVAYDPIIKNNSTVSYKRKGWGFKGGYNFHGDELGIIFFTAKDDASSLSFVPAEALITPQENYVAAITAKKRLFKKFNIQIEYALSAINTDKTAEEKSVANTNNLLGFLLPKKANTRFYDAFKGSFGYNGRSYGLQLNYERITPEYKTLGAYFFNNDLRNITIAPNLRLMKGKMNISANLGLQTNNLDKAKNSTTRRFVGNATVAYARNDKWNYNAAYSNFTTFTNIRPQDDPFFQNNLDSLNFYQVNSNITVTVGHNFGSKEVRKSLNINTSYQKASDEQAGTQQGTRVSDFIMGNLAYTHSIAKKELSISAAANCNIARAPGNKSIFYGPNVNVSKRLFNKLVGAAMGASYNQNFVNGKNNSAVWNARLNLNYSPKPKKGEAKPSPVDAGEKKGDKLVKVNIKNPLKGKQSMSLNISYLNRLPAGTQPQGFREMTVTANWSYNF